MFEVGDRFIGLKGNRGWEWRAISRSLWEVTVCKQADYVGNQMDVSPEEFSRWMKEGGLEHIPNERRRLEIAQQISADHSEYYSAITEVDHEQV